MYGSKRRGRIRPLIAYLPKVLKFYDVKGEGISPLVFVLILAIGFAANLIPMKFIGEISISPVSVSTEELMNLLRATLIMNGISLGSFILSNLFSSAYLYAYIRDLRGVSYTARECWSFIGRRFPVIMVLSIVNMLAIFTGLFLFIVPGVILYLMFVFSNCYMMDKDTGVVRSLKSSLDLTHGFKGQIFRVIVFFNAIIILIPMMIGSSGGPLIYAFVSAFISAIINLMSQRLLALMYVDLEYVPNHLDEVES